MIKEGSLVRLKGITITDIIYYKVLSVDDTVLRLKLDKAIVLGDICNYEEITNEIIDWSKVPKGTTIYYFSDVDYCWVESEFLEYRLGTKEGWPDSSDYIIRRDKNSNDDLVLICKDAYIMDDWLENEIRMYQEDVDPKTSDKGTEELEKCLKAVENMTTEEYSELYNRVLKADTSNVFKDPTDEDIKENDLLNVTIKKHLNDKNNSGWRLPNKEELNLMYVNLHENNIGNLAVDYYWSSSEYHNYYAWVQNFLNGLQYNHSKYNSLRVRAIRGFKSSIDYKTGDNTGTGFIFSKEHHREGYKPYYQYKECAKEDLPNKLTWNEAMDYFNKGDAKVFSDKEIDDSVNKNQLKDINNVLDNEYNYIIDFLNKNKAHRTYINSLDIIYGNVIGNEDVKDSLDNLKKYHNYLVDFLKERGAPVPYLNSLNTIYKIAKINRSKNQLNDTKKYNERDMLKDAYNFLETFLESHKADNQYFNELDMLYSFAKIGLKSIDKM